MKYVVKLERLSPEKNRLLVEIDEPDDEATPEETYQKLMKHTKACTYCDSYESPDRYCATWGEHVKGSQTRKGCPVGGRLFRNVDAKKGWPPR